MVDLPHPKQPFAGIPHYTYNYIGRDTTTVSGQQPLSAGPTTSTR